uniref:Uncharacterized protein n=1 Tax=Globisporangium ultimum (strain ATCC 200006 / CBS 805.95 / DAOM BR144) TaxID=431595 RepID=K3WY38_GLOUD
MNFRCSSTCFVSLIPFAHPDHELIHDLNDISEVCSVLTFLLQITILSRDVNRKVKLKTLQARACYSYFSHWWSCARMPSTSWHRYSIWTLSIVNEITENCLILFIVASRFYILSMTKSFKRMVQAQKAEMLYYFLFCTRGYPFELLNYATGLSWEHVQGVWMQIAIVLCLWMTARAKLTSYSSKMGKSTGLGEAVVSTEKFAPLAPWNPACTRAPRPPTP